jgi:hypothetical protein
VHLECDSLPRETRPREVVGEIGASNRPPQGVETNGVAMNNLMIVVATAATPTECLNLSPSRGGRDERRSGGRLYDRRGNSRHTERAYDDGKEVGQIRDY